MPDESLVLKLQTPEQVRATLAKSHGDSLNRAEGNLDLVQTFGLIYRMLKVDAPNIVFVPAFPKYLRPETQEYKKTIDDPSETFPITVTYRVVRQEPATTGGNKEPFGTGFKELTPHERMRTGMRDGTQVVVYGQNFDNEVRFEIWALTNFEAERIVNWFSQYLRNRRVWLRNQGVGEVLFMRRTDFQENSSDLRNGLEYRSLIFYFRTEELSTEDEQVLKNLEVSLGLIERDPSTVIRNLALNL